MEFRIADTFLDSLGRLSGEEQKAVKTTTFDLQVNPANPGLSFHKLEKARDKSFCSVRVNADLRLIVHRTDGSMLLCYVDHHDKAYGWAERRKLETHPKTGAAQLVEIRETVQEIVVPRISEVTEPAARLEPIFARFADEELLGFGVPAEWLADVRAVTLDSVLALVEHLPSEAAEALLELATGGKPRITEPAAKGSDPFEHPDAQRRFRVMADVEELQRALDFPWEKWSVFLHPEQRQWVDREYSGPARVSGSAGTGKTIVALHRAAHLARKYSDSRVLLTTFSDTLAHMLKTKMGRLVANEPRVAERIEVCAIDKLGIRLYKSHFGSPILASIEEIRELLAETSGKVGGHKFSLRFLETEWQQVVDTWQVQSWEAYRDVQRLGRKTRLPESQRAILWSIFELVLAELAERGAVTPASMYNRLAARLSSGGTLPFDFAVVDEAQDFAVHHIRFLAALAGNRPNGLFFAADQGQRIFQQPFSWKSLGVDIRGRSKTLRVNYRTSHQIRSLADRLLPTTVQDIDGNAEARNDTVSVFNGPVPEVRILQSSANETSAVADWLRTLVAGGIQPQEMGVFVRSEPQVPRACRAIEEAGLSSCILDESCVQGSGQVAISTMHLAKGLEFRAVIVMACDDEILPLQERIEAIADEADLQEVYDTERHLLYVACTRARDHLLVTAVKPASEFLDDLALRSSSTSTKAQASY